VTFDVVDLYAGPGGWDEGMRMLGMTSVVGIEWDHAACLTAVAAGHQRIRADVSKYSIDVFAGAQGLIASPPCQAWSMAGKRQGEVDRAKVHALVDAYANGGNDPGTDWADERSHHAAQPVRWIRQLRPAWVALEQVPPVLPLWQHVAERMRRWGYSTWTGVLNSADYGVPQTRERAILVARLDGPAQPPAPTHAKSPAGDLFGDVLEAWVSMAAALGWAGVDRPARTVCGDRSPRWAYGQGNSTATGWTPETENRSETAAGRVPYLRSVDRPAPTVVSNADRWELHTNRDQRPDGSRQVVPIDAPAPAFTAKAGGQWVLRNGNRPNACERSLDEPAGTMFFGHALNDVQWYESRPSTTVLGSPRIGRPGHKDRDKGEAQFERDSLRITQTEAAVLQSFRPDYPWQGTKTKQFEQIGNAVPPLLAAHVIAVITGSKVPT
jgi:DNA (cytosine-5)-methyltransferase 1